MICFEVQLNGNVLCTAGVGDLGSLHVILTWVKRDPKHIPEGFDPAEWSKEELNLNLGGSIRHGEQGHEFHDWISHQDMSVGDEIAIRILDQPHCDLPSAKRVDASEFVEQKKREYFEQLKKEYAENNDEE